MESKITDLADALIALTIAEAIQLQECLESRGLKFSQPTIVQAPTSTADANDAIEQFHALKITNGGSGKLKIVAEYKNLTSLGLKESKAEIDSGEPLFKNATIETIKAAIATFESVSPGFTGEIISQDKAW